jgi:hypothetical protein
VPIVTLEDPDTLSELSTPTPADKSTDPPDCIPLAPPEIITDPPSEALSPPKTSICPASNILLTDPERISILPDLPVFDSLVFKLKEPESSSTTPEVNTTEPVTPNILVPPFTNIDVSR